MNNKKYLFEIEKLLKTPLTDKDINKYLPDTNNNIIKYSDLKKYKSIYDLLPTDKSFKIILLEQKKNNGHWMLILRYNNIIELFNSYGVKFETEFKFIPKFMQKLLKEDKNDLHNLLKTVNKNDEIIYNHQPLQSMKEGINTCGRWCLMRILFMKDYNYNLQEYLDYMYDLHNETNKPYDIIVCDYIK